MSTKKSRSYEKKFEVAAPVEAVWKAITEAEELTRWFCKEASCQPGPGGEMHIDWGGGAHVTQVISVWEPNAHLRTEALRAISGAAAAAGPDEPYATDWYLEHEAGVTRVRMVASGFGEGPEWDHEYDGTFHGWDLYHKTLKHYLEHHRGLPAHNVVLYAELSVPPEEAWKRLMGPDGFCKEGHPEALAAQSSFRFVTRTGDVLAGVVRELAPPKSFGAMIESLNKAVLNMELSSPPGRGDFLYLSLSTWGVPEAEVEALGGRLRSIVYGLFPQKTAASRAGCAAPE